MISRMLLGILALSLIAVAGLSSRPSETRAADLVFETQMFGTEQVPPVDTVAWGFFRFFFNEDRSSADVTVDIKGLAGATVISADIHRGAAGTNGPVVKHLADGGYIVTSATVSFTAADLQEMASGNWYISLKTADHPNGELRGQIQPPAGFLPSVATATPTPAAVPAGAGLIIRPPSTGSAGLLP